MTTTFITLDVWHPSNIRVKVNHQHKNCDYKGFVFIEVSLRKPGVIANEAYCSLQKCCQF